MFKQPQVWWSWTAALAAMAQQLGGLENRMAGLLGILGRFDIPAYTMRICRPLISGVQQTSPLGLRIFRQSTSDIPLKALEVSWTMKTHSFHPVGWTNRCQSIMIYQSYLLSTMLFFWGYPHPHLWGLWLMINFWIQFHPVAIEQSVVTFRP